MSQEHMTIREHMLDVAGHEFLEKGYKHAALREIAQKAGVTTGALYGYFKNKEEIFGALVDEPYHRMIAMYREILTDFQSLSPEKQCRDMMSYTALGMSRMTDYLYEHYTAFKLILCCSEGTIYSNLIHEMAVLDVEATHEFAEVLNSVTQPSNPVNKQLEHMLVSGMFTAFFEMVVHDVAREDANEYTTQLLAFYEAGWGKIMGW